MLYLAIKALHIVAAIFWIGALMLLCILTSSKPIQIDQMRLATRLTEAAIGFTWLFGIVLVVMGKWYYLKWWYIKVALVIVISAIHSVVHRRWKRASEDGVKTNSAVAYFLFPLVLAVVFLVVFKRPV